VINSSNSPAKDSTVSIPLNTAGINKGGRTEYKVKSAQEPRCYHGDSAQLIEFDASEYRSGVNKPRLVIAYTLPCGDECSPSGTKQCTVSGGTQYKTCGDYDGDGCLEWSSAASCLSGQTCSGSGDCSTSPSNGGQKPSGGGKPPGGGTAVGTLETLQLEITVPYLIGSLKAKADVGGVSKDIEISPANKSYTLDLKGSNLSLNKEYNLVITSGKTLVRKTKFTPTSASTNLKVADLILGDINQDNSIDSTDQISLADSIASQTSTGDLNADTATNSMDWAILLANFGKKGD
jgi:hypothetical protein